MIAARVAMAMGLVALLSGCFDSKEDQATAAYRTRDFAAARELARELADAGNPRGIELQALMAAQGLGRAVDFAEAVALIDRAVAIDPSFQASRRAILDQIAASGAVARTLFEGGQYRRALVLAEALAEGISVNQHENVEMPEFAFESEQIDNLLTYLDSLK